MGSVQERNVPPAVRKRLNLPGPDEGIDLVAETVDGGFWAIQCKYKENEEHSLTRGELSTFTDLSFGICKGIEFGLVCTTADRDLAQLLVSLACCTAPDDQDGIYFRRKETLPQHALAYHAGGAEQYNLQPSSSFATQGAGGLRRTRRQVSS